jgi:hypothetical protein
MNLLTSVELLVFMKSCEPFFEDLLSMYHNIEPAIPEFSELYFLLYGAYQDQFHTNKEQHIATLMKRYGTGYDDTEKFITILSSAKKVTSLNQTDTNNLKIFISNIKNISIFKKDIDAQIEYLSKNMSSSPNLKKFFSFLKQTPKNEIEKLIYVKSLIKR